MSRRVQSLRRYPIFFISPTLLASSSRSRLGVENDPAPQRKHQLLLVIIFYNVKSQMTPATTWMTSSWPNSNGLEGLIVWSTTLLFVPELQSQYVRSSRNSLNLMERGIMVGELTGKQSVKVAYSVHDPNPRSGWYPVASFLQSACIEV